MTAREELIRDLKVYACSQATHSRLQLLLLEAIGALAEPSVRPEAALMTDVLRVIFWNTDENGDPVGAQPETQWEQGYAAGIRYVYRVMKGRGVQLPQLGEQPTEKK